MWSSISIIICVHSVKRDVIGLLESLEIRQGDEVLVVSTGPAGLSQQLQDAVGVGLTERLKLRIIEGPCGHGAPAGRNVGIEHARSDVLLFLDSDILCEPDIAEIHRSYYTDPSIVAVAGPVNLLPNCSNRSIVNRCVLRSKYFSPFGQDSSEDIEWAPLANLSARRIITKEVGFDEAFPRAGGGEDIDFCWRMRNHGRIVRAPEAIVRHPVWNTASILPRLFRWGWAQAVLLQRHPDRAFISIGSMPEILLLGVASAVVGLILGKPWIEASIITTMIFIAIVIICRFVCGQPLEPLFEYTHDMGLMCSMAFRGRICVGWRIRIDHNQEMSVRISDRRLLLLYVAIAAVVYIAATVGYV